MLLNIEMATIDGKQIANMPYHAGVETLLTVVFSFVSLWNFETIRGSLMTPKWQKLAGLAREMCTL